MPTTKITTRSLGVNVARDSLGMSSTMASFLSGATATDLRLAMGVSHTTGTGTLVFSTSPTITTPSIGQINTLGGQALFIQGGAITSEGVLAIRGTSASQNSIVTFRDTTAATRGAVGYGNTSSAVLSGTIYLLGGSGIPLALGTNNTERMRILSDGNVGIGTSTPNERLTVSGNLSATGTIIASNYNPAANVATFLASPTSANLAAAVTDETGTRSLVFNTNPTLSGANINSGTIRNATIQPTMASHIIVDEDFPNGSAAYALQGSGTGAIPNAESFSGRERGYVRLATGTVSGNQAFVSAPNEDYVNYTRVFAKIRLASITDVRVFVGISQIGASSWTGHRVGVLFDPALSSGFRHQWNMVTATTSGGANIVSSPTVSVNTDYIIGISVLGAGPYQGNASQSYKVGIWDASGAFITEQTFSFTGGGMFSGVSAGVFIQTQTSAARIVYVDWLKVLSTQQAESFPFIETWA
jgi:hypothetical protein